MATKDTTLVEKLVKARRDGRQEGRKEVVETIIKDGVLLPDGHYENEGFHHKPEDCKLCWWQAKLKDWGIK